MSEGQALGEAISRASESLAKPDGGSNKTTSSETKETRREAPSAAESKDDDAWEGEPGWVKQWKKPGQSAIR